MVFCSICGKEMPEDSNYCGGCGHETNSNSSAKAETVKTTDTHKRSNFWYLVPIIFSLLGGIVAYLVLRKSDSNKAKICLAIGIVIFILWSAAVMVSASNNNVADVNKTTEKVEKTPAVKETQKIIADNDFDPALIKSAKENIPIIQETAQVYLSECRNVKSYSDYQIYSIAMSVYSEQIIKNTEQLNAILTVLEINGYDEHPEVGPLIEETRGMYLELSQCIDGLIDKYER